MPSTSSIESPDGEEELYDDPPPPQQQQRPDMFNQALKMPSEFNSFTPPTAHNNKDDEQHDEAEEAEEALPSPPSLLLPSSNTWCNSSTPLLLLLLLRPTSSFSSLVLVLFVVLGVVFAVLAGLESSSSSSWHWFALTSALLLAPALSRLVVYAVQYALWLAPTRSGTLIAFYYLTICSLPIQLVLTTACWVASWYLAVFNYHTGDTSSGGYFYATQLFWWLFATAALACAGSVGKCFARLYFERTTYWFRVNACAAREFDMLRLCPKAPTPHAAVAHLHAQGEEATKADPLVLRMLTKYIQRKHLVAQCAETTSSATADPPSSSVSTLDLATSEDWQDVAQVIFNHFYAGYDNVLGEIVTCDASSTRARMASLRALRSGTAPQSPRGRAIFSPFNAASSSSTTAPPRQPVVPSSAASTASSSSSSSSSAPHPAPAPLPPPPMTLRALGKSASSTQLSFKLPVGASSASTSSSSRHLQQRHPVMRRLIVRNSSLTLEHFEKRYAELFPHDTREQALKQWEALFSPMKQAAVSLRAMRTLYASFYTERVGLADTLKDSQAAINRLGRVCDFVVVVCSLVALALLMSSGGGQSYQVWIGLTSFLVTLAVVFGSSAARVVENLVFMFFRHPYDVGDLLFYEGSYYSVRKIELLSTTLIRWNGEYSQIPNDKLATIALCNLSRSGLHWELIEAFVDVATCNERFVQLLSDHMNEVAVNRPESFSGKVQIICKTFGRPLLLKVQAYVEFSYCPTNLTRLFEDIGRVNQAFADALRRHSATESGVGAGAIRADGHNKPVPFLVPAAGLATAQAIALATGLSTTT